MLRKALGVVAITLLLMGMSAPAVLAVPTVGGVYNGVFFENNEVFVNNVGEANVVDVGDVFWGVLFAQNIKNAGTDPTGQAGSSFWLAGGALGPPQEITAYFLTAVTAVIPIPGDPFGNSLIVLGPAAVDPNGIFDAAELAAGAVLQVYEGAFNYDTTNQGTGFSTATDGLSSWMLGMTNQAYWYSIAPASIPAAGSFVGESYAGLNILIGPDLTFINDPNEAIANGNVQFYFNSEIYRTSAPVAVGPTSPFPFNSNDPAVFLPVPEPASLLLLGGGLIGLAAVARRRFKK